MIKREQILETAFNAFTSKGIKEVKMEEIAAGLKISKKTLYDYFKSKKDLLVQSVEYKFPQLLEKNSKIIKCMPNPLTALVFCAVENIRFWCNFKEKFIREAFMDNLRNFDEFKNAEEFPSQLCFSIVITILGGLCTQKGKIILDELKENYS